MRHSVCLATGPNVAGRVRCRIAIHVALRFTVIRPDLGRSAEITTKIIYYREYVINVVLDLQTLYHTFFSRD